MQVQQPSSLSSCPKNVLAVESSRSSVPTQSIPSTTRTWMRRSHPCAARYRFRGCRSWERIVARIPREFMKARNRSNDSLHHTKVFSTRDFACSVDSRRRTPFCQRNRSQWLRWRGLKQDALRARRLSHFGCLSMDCHHEFAPCGWEHDALGPPLAMSVFGWRSRSIQSVKLRLKRVR